MGTFLVTYASSDPRDGDIPIQAFGCETIDDAKKIAEDYLQYIQNDTRFGKIFVKRVERFR